MNRRAFGAVAAAGFAAAAVPLPAPAWPDAMSWYAADLHGALVLGHNPELVLPAASLIKLLIARTLVDDLDSGALHLDDGVPLTARDRVDGSDSFGQAKPGSYPVKHLLDAMLSESDNTAANALLRYAGFDRCNRRAIDSGLRFTRVRRSFYDWAAERRGLENTTTTLETARLLTELLGLSQRPAPAGIAARVMMDALLAQTDRETIPTALGGHRTIANKTGELPGIRGDAAIVDYGSAREYVVCIIDSFAGAPRDAAIAGIRSAALSLDRQMRMRTT